MEALFLRVVWISLTCSAVLVPLLVGKGWLRQHVRAKALYVVWLILALRLVVPVDLSLPEPAVTVEAPSYQVALPARTPSANLPAGAQIEEPSAVVGQTAPAAASAVRTIPVTALLSALWLFGALAAALVQGGGYLLARRRLLRDARPDLEAEAQAGQTAASLGLKRAVLVRRSRQVRTPMVLGLLRPVLLLPEGQAVDEVVLCHELTHLKRLDLAYKALLVAACWLHWFNPLVWWMSRAASENLELCCDDDVAAGRDAAFRRKYGELLLSTAEEKPGPTLSSRFGGSKQAMKDRLTNLFVKKKRGRLLACAALAVLALVGGLVACEGRPAMTDMEALEALEESLSYDGERVSFTIPEGDREWNIHIAGRADT
ncbi:M56 family metallopeptidase, partial [Pseudoflavonifractor capillosus]|uniref:M56 family metallopeptidase n=1 Tax=Pseudoflavonifractor capillosus TaxID=106588 RepID=UPI00195B3F8D